MSVQKHVTNPPSPSRLIDIDAVCSKIGGSRPVNASTIYRLMQQGRLPRPIKFSSRLVRWSEREIDEAIQRQADAKVEDGNVSERQAPPRRIG